MSIKLFGTKICPFQLIIGEDGELSLTKLWTNLCYGVLTYKMMVTELTWDLMTAYGSIVGGSYVATKFVSMKYASTPEPANVTVQQTEAVNVAGDVTVKKGRKK